MEKTIKGTAYAGYMEEQPAEEIQGATYDPYKEEYQVEVKVSLSRDEKELLDRYFQHRNEHTVKQLVEEHCGWDGVISCMLGEATGRMRDYEKKRERAQRQQEIDIIEDQDDYIVSSPGTRVSGIQQRQGKQQLDKTPRHIASRTGGRR